MWITLKKIRNHTIHKVIVPAGLDTSACYGVSKCAEIVFEHGKMVKGEGLQVLQERMKALRPDQEEMYKFLGVEQAKQSRCMKELKKK